MAEPRRVAECVEAMQSAVSVPVTVKCRIGIDDQDSEESLSAFVAAIAAAGCRTVIVHARKAWLKACRRSRTATCRRSIIAVSIG